jgi:hypothetical protein
MSMVPELTDQTAVEAGANRNLFVVSAQSRARFDLQAINAAGLREVEAPRTAQGINAK